MSRAFRQVRLPATQLAWSDLLVFYSNLDLKMHRFGAGDMGRTDKQTYGSIA